MKRKEIKNTVTGVLAVALLGLAIMQTVRIRQMEAIDFEAAAHEKMQESAAFFNDYFSETDSLQTLITTLLSAQNSMQNIEKALKRQERQYKMKGFYIVPSGKGNAVLFSNGNKGFQLIDAHCRRQKWFEHFDAQEKTTWGSPIFDSTLNRRVVYCNRPFYREKQQKAHIVFLYEATAIYLLLHETGLTRFGLPYMIDSLTNFVAHPLDETRSFLDLAKDYGDKTLIRMSEDVINRRPLSGKYTHINTVTGQRCNERLLPIEKTGWLLGVSVYDGVPLETAEYQKTMRHAYMQTIIYCAICLMLLLLLLSYSKISIGAKSRYMLFPPVLLTMMIAVVVVYNRFPQQSEKKVNPDNTSFSDNETGFSKWEQRRIVDKQSLNGFIDSYQQESMELYEESAKIIPTGIYIYGVEFMDSHAIKVTGMCWQKYLQAGADYPEEIRKLYHFDTYEDKGVFFPGGHVSSIELTDSLNITIDHYPATLFRWNFDIEIERQLSYSLYPFGKNDIPLLLWSNDIDDNTMLTPDLDSYKQIYPTDRPGLDNHFHIRGWDIAGAYYSYSMESYLCNFGNTNIYGINLFPELVYNISISRKFIDILICKIVPLMVVLVLLFTILFVRMTSDGFNNIIGCSGLFFVLVLDHIHLRESVLSEQIMYLEFCYFFSYILLLLITITSFDISKSGRSYNSWVDNVLKRYFWTIIFGAMAIVTTVFFW